ncbi:uncharacterized protein LOC132560780 [Ylistrum balloti]|uniref:uncharacterized protein LOC132560780 n=1 Tax=Ylistrum balloti TaxID=509963 RepID=UPI00290580E0|nr:uncharacterized protein LOC132560780 [Ylistrum balloti]
MGWLTGYMFIAVLFSHSAGLFLTIAPSKIQYIGRNDVTIRCELGETEIANLGWMQILKQNLLMEKRPFLSLRVIDGVGPEWGSGIDVEKLDEKTSVRFSTKPMEETYLEVTLHQIECEDEGVYSCEVFGMNLNESLVKESIREELIVNSFGRQPTITYFSTEVPDHNLVVSPGSDVTLLCSGLVGKPHMPLKWYRFNEKAGVFLELNSGVSEETLMVDKDNMCSYNGSRYLTYTADYEEGETTFRCQIGPFFDIITVMTTESDSKSFYSMFNRDLPNLQTVMGSGKAKGLLLNINPSKVQYQGDFDVTIKCSVGDLAENLTRLGYLQLLKEGPVSLKRPYLTLTAMNGTEPEWGTGIDSQKLDMKSTITYRQYPPEEAFLQVTLHRMECDDEGIYTCVLFGIDDDNNIMQKTVREELSIYTYAGEPWISINGQTFPTKEVHVSPGINLTLTCAGPVGKPHVPVQWYKYDMMAGTYIYTTEGVATESLDLPMDHLCRYTGTSKITFFTTTLEHDVTYECKIGAFADTITVVMDGGPNDISLMRDHQKKQMKEEINVAEVPKGSRVLCIFLIIVGFLNIQKE